MPNLATGLQSLAWHLGTRHRPNSCKANATPHSYAAGTTIQSGVREPMTVEMTRGDRHTVAAVSLRADPAMLALVGRMDADEQARPWGPPIWPAEKPTRYLTPATDAGWRMLGLAFSRR
jgi:hypothetical protein